MKRLKYEASTIVSGQHVTWRGEIDLNPFAVSEITKTGKDEFIFAFFSTLDEFFKIELPKLSKDLRGGVAEGAIKTGLASKECECPIEINGREIGIIRGEIEMDSSAVIKPTTASYSINISSSLRPYIPELQGGTSEDDESR